MGLFHVLKSLKQRTASLAISQEKEKKKKRKKKEKKKERRVEEHVPGPCVLENRGQL